MEPHAHFGAPYHDDTLIDVCALLQPLVFAVGYITLYAVAVVCLWFVVVVCVSIMTTLSCVDVCVRTCV